MSRKSRRNRPDPVVPPPHAEETPPTGRINRTGAFIAATVVLVLAFAGAAMYYTSHKAQSAQLSAPKNASALASADAPTFGDPAAKVHVVEFLDPACETCAVFFQHVKKLMAADPGRIRLTLRHVSFHKGSEHAVRVLEGARKQDKYLPTLEALFATQDQWAINHEVRADLVWKAIQAVGLDLRRLESDMNAPEVARRMEQDMVDARALGVTKTPEFFVNGRPLPSFGLQQLQGLVSEELRNAYR